MNLILTWSKNCVITDITTRAAGEQGNLPEIRAPTSSTFFVVDAKSYVPVVTLPTQDDNKLLQQLKTGFKRTVTWIKCRSERSYQSKNNNSSYPIDPKFNKAYRLFVLSSEN